MAVRVTCEDADNGFKPTCGKIDELNFRTSPEVWGYFSVKSGGGIHEYSDSQVSCCLFSKHCVADQHCRESCFLESCHHRECILRTVSFARGRNKYLD